MKPAALWPVAVIGALVVTVVANVLLLFAANDPGGRAVVEPDYYRKAVAWDSTMAQEAANDSLGWSVDARLEAAAGESVVRARVADRAGVPIEGARVSVVGIHNVDAGNPVAGALRETTPGDYEAALPFRHAGLWELRFLVQHGHESVTARIRRDLSARP